MAQNIVIGKGSLTNVPNIIEQIGAKKVFLVCDSAYEFIGAEEIFAKLTVPYVKFSSFTSNPLYSDTCNGVELFRKEQCDIIVVIGGGSAIDVAKCIKLFSGMDGKKNFLYQPFTDSKIPLIAIPTTAGTGSESTRYAVIYYEGKKQSISHESIIPDYAILDCAVLNTLPVYQKKCTLLDALCQGIESWWSVNSNDESKRYSKQAVETILKYTDDYIFDNSTEAAEKILVASNYSGRAINITQTTAPHAMSYKITSMYNLPHGHAVAICLPVVWKYMVNNLDYCIDRRGKDYLEKIFTDIANAFNVATNEDAIKYFMSLLNKLNISSVTPNENDIEVLAKSVNPIRLRNNPIELTEEVLRELYLNILNP